MSCKNSLKAEIDTLEQQWCEKERAYQQELDLRRTQKEALDDEIEGLRDRVVQLTAAEQAAIAAKDLAERNAATTLAAAAAAASKAQHQSAQPVEPPTSLNSAERAELETSRRELEELRKQLREATSATAGSASLDGESSLPPQAYNLQASVAWQDLVNLRQQVRELEKSVREERERAEAEKRSCDNVRNELRDLSQQQKLNNTVGQHQQMEYIRNVFKKFVESLPVGGTEQEQLIPVLMTFFRFEADDAKAIHGKRSGGGFWNRLGR